MKTVTIESTIGNYAYTLAVDIAPEHEDVVLARGVTHAAQRIGEVDEVLGIVTVDDKGKATRNKLTRNDVPFSQEKADALAKLLAKLNIGTNKLPTVLPARVTVTVNDRDDATSKEASAMALRSIGAHESAGDLEEWLLVAAKYDGPTHTPDGEQYNPEAIAAVLPLARARIAEIKAATKTASL